jgi:hypothetical protein
MDDVLGIPHSVPELKRNHPCPLSFFCILDQHFPNAKFTLRPPSIAHILLKKVFLRMEHLVQ